MELGDLITGALLPFIVMLIFGSTITMFAGMSDVAVQLTACIGGNVLIAAAYVIFGTKNGSVAYRKLYVNQTLIHEPITLPHAQSVIREILNDEQPLPVTVEKIIEEVSRMQGVPPEEIKSTRQKANISLARKMCMYIMREVTTLTLEQIGEEYGKNYSTVIYSIKEIQKKMEEDSKIERKINDIINNVKTAS